MSKIKSYVLTLIAVIASVCCFGLVACAGDGGNTPAQDTEYTVTWTVGEHATVAATGYDALPTKLKNGTEVTFTVTMDEGWELISVAPTNNVSKQTDGSYKFTVAGNIEIRVITQEEGELPPITLPCILGWAIGPNVTVDVIGYDEPPLTVQKGTIIKFNATPAEGYVVTVSPDTVAKQSDGTYIFEVTESMGLVITAEKAEDEEKHLLFDLANVCFSATGENVHETIDDYEREVFIRPFRAMGKFIDGQSAYIKLVEVESRQEFKGETVTRAEDDDWFTLKFDYRVLVEEFGDVEFGEYVDFEVYICATDADGKEHDVRLDTADYEIDGRLVFTSYKVVDYMLRNVKYTIDYYSAYNEDPDNTKVFIALTAEGSSNYSGIIAKIEVRDDVPYIDFSGQFYASYKRSEAMEALNNFVDDICAFGDWSNGRSFTQSATLDDDWEFTVSVDISKLPAGKTYVMHATMKKSQTGDTNLVFEFEPAEETYCGEKTYKLVWYDTGWGWNWSGVEVGQNYIPGKEMEITGTTIKVVDGKPYYTITYAYEGYTQTEIKALPVNFDLQCNDNINGGGWGRNFFDDKISFVIDEENGTFDVRIDISSLRALHGYTTHYSLDKEDGDRVGETNTPSDYKPNIDGLDGLSVACGDITYTFMYKKGSGEGSEYWGCVGLRLTNTPGYSATVNTTVQLAAESNKMYVVITGTYEGYTESELKARVLVDYQDPDHDWAYTTFTAEQLIITVDEEAGTFTVKADITNTANGQYLFHFNGTDIGNENGIAAITCGNKKYSYENRDFGGWTRYVLTIADAE